MKVFKYFLFSFLVLATPSVFAMNNDSDKETQEKACMICFEPVDNGEEKVELPCKHAWHTECIKTWVPETATCPLCRESISHEFIKNTMNLDLSLQEKKPEDRIVMLGSTTLDQAGESFLANFIQEQKAERLQEAKEYHAKINWLFKKGLYTLFLGTALWTIFLA